MLFLESDNKQSRVLGVEITSDDERILLRQNLYWEISQFSSGVEAYNLAACKVNQPKRN